MYFVRSGELGYNFDHTPHLTDEIDPGSRISEPALWMQWHYRGRLACTAQNSHLFSLDAMTFRKVMTRSQHADLFTLYGRLFTKMMEDYCDNNEEDASDLYGNDEQVNKMLKLCSMMAAGTKTDLRAVFLAWKKVLLPRSQMEIIQSRICCIPTNFTRLIRKKRGESSGERDEEDQG
ncbi:unnamed protein product [Durusdinium trenchii]